MKNVDKEMILNLVIGDREIMKAALDSDEVFYRFVKLCLPFPWTVSFDEDGYFHARREFEEGIISDDDAYIKADSFDELLKRIKSLEAS